MQKKTPFIILALLFLVIACKNSSSTEAEREREESVMYQQSELASLMLYMHSQHEAWKTQIESDSLDLDNALPQEFLGIYTVTPTDSNVRNDEFVAFADNYVAKVEKLLKSKKNKKQVKLYNASIDACIDCHSKFCQGPIDKIEKLYIAN